MDTTIQNAPNERVSWETLHAQIGTVKTNISFKELVAAQSENIFILNAHRQVVFITRSCLDLFNIDDPATVYGCRPGEMMACSYAQQNGCGGSLECQICGGFQAANACLKGTATSREFQLQQSDGQPPIQLTVHAEALTIEGQLFMMISLISQ